MTEQKQLLKIKEFNEKDIESLKSIFEDNEIMSDEDKKNLIQKREKARKSNTILGGLFLYCYDTLNDYSYVFEDEENKGLRKRVEDYLRGFYGIMPQLRILIEDYEEDQIGSYYDGEKIKEYVRNNRDQMNKLINLFFSLISERRGLGMIPGMT